jgi:hypothetical protein
MDIKALFKEKRPNLSDSSINTYCSTLSNLHKKIFGSKDIDIHNFGKVDEILHYLKDTPINTRRTNLSALFVITEDKKYRDKMMDDIETIKHETSNQEQSNKQKENTITQEELNKIYEKLKKRASLLYKSKDLNVDDLMEIQDYIILSLFILIPPRRVMDYTEFKIKNINRETDNYMDKNTFVFNQYKTAKTYGTQKVEIPKELKTLITKWIKHNDTDYLLFNNQKNKLIGTTLTQRLNRIFGRNISVNAIRHSYLSDKYQSSIQQNKNISEDMTQMGSSISQQKTYIQTL